MLRMMRDNASSWIIKVMLSAIVIVFIFWGVGSFRSQRVGRAAMVNGKTITIDEYRKNFDRLINQYERSFNRKLDAEMIKMLNLKQQALDQLIDREVLRQEAQRLGFRVSESELIESIQGNELFQRAGTFDNSLYKRILDRNRLTPEKYEVLYRDDLLISKLQSFVIDNAKVSDQEAREWYNWQNEQMKIDYVLFDKNKYTDVEPGEEEIDTYWKEHQAEYKTEPMRKVRFIQFINADYLPKIEVTDEEIEDYYNINISEFETEKTVEARHILIKTKEDDPEAVIEEKKQEALKIMEMAKNGQDFAELASTYSQGPTKDKGGDLGAFKRGDMVKPFADKAFSMSPGEISEPVHTKFGWHVIKVEKVNEAETQPLEEVKSEIENKIKDRKVKEVVFDEAEKVYKTAFRTNDLNQVAETMGLNMTTTDFFPRKGPQIGISNSYKFAAAAFTLEKNEISTPQDLGDSYVLIQLLDIKEPEQETLENVKEKVKRAVTQQMKEEMAFSEAEEFMSAVKNDVDFATAAQEFTKEIKTTDYFKRQGAIPEIGYENEISQAAFKLTADNPYPDKVIKGKKGNYVIRFKERKIPTEEEFNEKKAETQQQLLRRKQSKVLDTWLSQIKTKQEIIIEDGIL